MKEVILQYMLLWQMLFLLVLGLVLLAVSHHMLSYARKKLEDRQAIWPTAFLRAFYRPWIFFLGLFVVSLLAQAILAHYLGSWLPRVVVLQKLLLALSVFWFLKRFISFYEQDLFSSAAKTLSAQERTSIRALMQVFRVALFILAVLVVLQIFNQNITALLAFGGVGGLALSFAAKDSLANVLGGMMIFVDRHFSVGDWIRSPDRNIEGTVEHIGWRLTKIRTFDKRPLYVPNGVFSTISIENPSRMTNRRIKAIFGVRYDDASKMNVIVDEIKLMLQSHPDIDTNQTLMVNFVEFAASSLDIMVYTFTKTTSWSLFQDVRQDVFLKILDIISRHSAECAFPTSTVHMPSGLQLDKAKSTQPAADKVKPADGKESKTGLVAPKKSRLEDAGPEDSAS